MVLNQFLSLPLRALLLGALLFNVSPPSIAEVDLDVEVTGVEDELLDNVLAYLSLEQRQDEESLNERWVRILHQDAPSEIRAALGQAVGVHAANRKAGVIRRPEQYLAEQADALPASTITP